MKCSKCGKSEGKYVRYLQKGITLWCTDCFLPTILPHGLIGWSLDDPAGAVEAYLKGNEPTLEQYFYMVVDLHYGV